jgi:hypothetical protein
MKNERAEKGKKRRKKEKYGPMEKELGFDRLVGSMTYCSIF